MALSQNEPFSYGSGLCRSCSAVRSDYMHFFHSADDGFLPWTGVLSGMFIASVYYWCTDQVRVNRQTA
jgi:uncharacterized sodium:solute symporter family permease YidK